MRYQVKTKHPTFDWVCVPEKYIISSIKNKEDLVVIYKEEEMSIKNSDISSRIKGYSEFQKDQFRREDYRLVFFSWRPKTEEEEAKEFSQNCL